ncbi:MAG: hypothetical protein SPF98_02000 [Campylobacter sp.]|nr:hypothetical protein [Campylobacter sp.]
MRVVFAACVLILPCRPQNRTNHHKTTPQNRPQNRHAQKRSGERFFRPPFDPLRRQFISLSAKKIAFAFVLKPY